MSFKKFFWFLLLSSLVTYCSLKEKTPEAVFEDALEDPQGEEAAGFCTALTKLEILKDAYDQKDIAAVVSTQNDSNISCYIKQAVQAGGDVEKRLDRYAYKVFLSGKEDKIDAMLRNGLDPDLNMKNGEEVRPTDVYYSKRSGTRVIEVEKTGLRHSSGKGGNQMEMRTYKTTMEVPNHQFLGAVSIPDVLKSRKEVELYLRGKGYPARGFSIVNTYSPLYVSLLDVAIQESNISLIRTLLEYGADITKSRWAERPVIRRRDDVIYPLLTLQQQDWSTLDKIIIRDDVDGFKEALITANFDEAQLTTVIDSLFTHQSPKILAEIGQMERFNFIYQKPDYLVKAYQTGNVDILTFMLNGGADLNTQTSLRKLPKSFVHLSRYYDVFEDKDIKGSVGDFMIAHALGNKAYELAQAIESIRYHWSPIHSAAVQKNSDWLKQLLVADPTLIELSDDRGQTPLMLAVKYQRNYIAKILLEQGADATKVSKEGETAMMYAIDSRNEWVVKTLLQDDATFTSNKAGSCDHLSAYVKEVTRKEYFFPQLHYSPGRYSAKKERKRLMVLNRAYLGIIERMIDSNIKERELQPCK